MATYESKIEENSNLAEDPITDEEARIAEK